MIATPNPNGPKVVQDLISWMTGASGPVDMKEVWSVADYRHEFLIATTAIVLWNQLLGRLGDEHIAVSHWIRVFKSVEKKGWVTALSLGRGQDVFEQLVYDEAVKALIEW